MFGGFGAKPTYKKNEDDSETVIISSQALCKMLKHGKAWIPLEVMGLMVGEFIDNYTVYVSDVFAMPQMGTGISVEAVDDAFQAEMLMMRKQVGYAENVVGWYHTHPGFGPWLSSIDQETQKMFEGLDPRSIAVVVDPVQSVRGKVMLESFRLMDPMDTQASTKRITVSNRGFLRPKDPNTIVHGLDKSFYQMPISFVKLEAETIMLNNIGYVAWDESVTPNLRKMIGLTADMKKMRKLAKNYLADVEEEVNEAKEKAKARLAKTFILDKETKIAAPASQVHGADVFKEDPGKENSANDSNSTNNTDDDKATSDDDKKCVSNKNNKSIADKAKTAAAATAAAAKLLQEKKALEKFDDDDDDYDVIQALRHVGRENPRKHVEDLANSMLANVSELEMQIMASSIAFTQKK